MGPKKRFAPPNFGSNSLLNARQRVKATGTILHPPDEAYGTSFLMIASYSKVHKDEHKSIHSMRPPLPSHPPAPDQLFWDDWLWSCGYGLLLFLRNVDFSASRSCGPFWSARARSRREGMTKAALLNELIFHRSKNLFMSEIRMLIAYHRSQSFGRILGGFPQRPLDIRC